MAKTTKNTGKRATAAGRGELRARKAAVAKTHDAKLHKPKPARPRPRKGKPSLPSETASLKRQIKTARLQQQASAEILRAVANASGDVARPLQQIAETTARLFGAPSVSIQLAEGGAFTREYRVGAIAQRIGSAYPRSNIRVGGRNLPGTVVFENRQIHIPDLDRLDPSMSDFPGLPHARAGGARTVCGTPLRCEGKAIGALIIFRNRLLPFTDDELALQQSFADQAVIAIENARLFNETREALARQTATSDILRVISQSPTDVQPVFDAIVLTARGLLGREMAGIMRCDDTNFWPVAIAGPEGLSPILNPAPMAINPDANFPSRAIVSKKNLHLPDWSTIDLPEYERNIRQMYGVNSTLYLPLLRDEECIGVLLLAGSQPGVFSETDIALAESFRDQAVIAIENARLFNETQQALERQTATADVLRIISRSVAHAAPVFDTILESCERLFNPYDAAVYVVEGDRVRGVARRGPGVGDWGADSMPLEGSSTGVAIAQGRPVHFPDLADKADLPEDKRTVLKETGGMTVLYAPMISRDSGVGSLVVTRRPKKPFTETEIDFIQSFADQAVIAIENARLFNETREALERQTATAEILKVIASSPSNVQPVFEAIAASAKKLIGGFSAVVQRFIGDELHLAAFTPTNPEADAALQASFPTPISQFPVFLLVRDGKTVEFTDTEAEAVPRLNRDLARLRGYRSMLFTPLMNNGAPIGMISVTRKEPGSFADHHVQLVRTFADQAVIAIENVRLFDEVKAKTADLSESLQQQIATADVLKVISRSAFDLQAVLTTLVRSALDLCNAPIGTFFLREGDVLRLASQVGCTPELVQYFHDNPIPLNQSSGAGRAFSTGRVVHFPDVLADPDYRLSEVQRLGDYRSLLAVPLLREQETIGVFSLSRTRPEPFSQRQIDLVQTFADQAVIAIENTRLFNETREALERQTATSEVLQVISNSISSATPVFERILESTERLITFEIAAIFLGMPDEQIHLAAFRGAQAAAMQGLYPRPLAQSLLPIMMATRRQICFEDAANGPDVPAFLRQIALATTKGNFSIAMTPLMWEGNAIGMLNVGRDPGVKFNERELSLLRTFADQAVIAIQNARLFEEVQARTRDLQESLEYQTATSDVLKVISRSSFDLQPVLDTLVDTAVKLCGALNGTICLREGDGYRYRASSGIHGDWARFLDEHPPTPGRGSMTGRVLLSGRPESVPDVLEDPDYVVPLAAMNKTRSVFGVPLLRHDRVEGVLLLARAEPGLFTQRQTELVQTFADQAVIAIENARLLTELRKRTDDLTESLEHLRTAQDRLVQTEKLASLGQLTAGIAHEIKNPLNFVNNFSALSAELIDELDETLAPAPLDKKMRTDVGELTQMLKSNLEKVVQHGKRADSIVKNMLLHSREGSGEQRPADINALLDESLNLAYHGARAEKPEFNITLRRDLDPDAGTINVFPQEITRAFINLISNGFYAASKRKAENGEADFEPVLSAATKNLGNHIEISIRDNGTGIPPEVRDKIFNPFFTTKPSGEGTGLGLSMSHDIIVKQHGGSIDVETEPGLFTEFKIVLPRPA